MYPFAVTLMQQDAATGTFSLLGAGVVMTPSTVLTTAVHLIRIPNSVLQVLWVQYGPEVMSPNSTSAIRVAAIEVHPQFDIGTRAFAACILHLSRPIDPATFATLGSGRLVLNADTALEAAGTLGTVVGWGVTTRSEPWLVLVLGAGTGMVGEEMASPLGVFMWMRAPIRLTRVAAYRWGGYGCSPLWPGVGCARLLLAAVSVCWCHD
jgi:hypothetical protein